MMPPTIVSFPRNLVNRSDPVRSSHIQHRIFQGLPSSISRSVSKISILLFDSKACNLFWAPQTGQCLNIRLRVWSVVKNRNFLCLYRYAHNCLEFHLLPLALSRVRTREFVHFIFIYTFLDPWFHTWRRFLFPKHIAEQISRPCFYPLVFSLCVFLNFSPLFPSASSTHMWFSPSWPSGDARAERYKLKAIPLRR
jgi:hypothetical protein